MSSESITSLLDVIDLIREYHSQIRKTPANDKELQKQYETLKNHLFRFAPESVAFCELTQRDENIHEGIVALFELLEKVAEQRECTIWELDPELTWRYWVAPKSDLTPRGKFFLSRTNWQYLALMDNLCRLGLDVHVACSYAQNREVDEAELMNTAREHAFGILQNALLADEDRNEERCYWETKLNHLLAPEVRNCILDEIFQPANPPEQSPATILAVYETLVQQIYAAGNWK
jgi:hypothetical protein